jgi:hypothetical protein
LRFVAALLVFAALYGLPKLVHWAARAWPPDVSRQSGAAIRTARLMPIGIGCQKKIYA